MDIERFVEDCVAANCESDAQDAVLEVLARAMENPAACLKALGEPERADINVLHRSETLTIFSAAWTPQMNLMPHNHLMWANIGIYTGREDNIMWRRGGRRLEGFGAKTLFEGDVAALAFDAIHSVTNPIDKLTGAIHVYGGDFFEAERSEWDPENLTEHAYDMSKVKAMFAD